MFVSTKLSQRYELILDPEAETSPLTISAPNIFGGGRGMGGRSFEFVFFNQYKPHYDYFFDEEHKKNNRMATILVYLTTPEEGGETIFPGAALIPIGSTESLFSLAHVRVCLQNPDQFLISCVSVLLSMITVRASACRCHDHERGEEAVA